MADGPAALRNPEPKAPARIEPMAVLPLFWKLKGRRVVLVGDSEGALWKAELLAAAGAELRIFAGTDHHPFGPLVAGTEGRVAVHPRAVQPADLDGAALAIADLEDEAEIAAFIAAARAAGVPVNIVDKPHLCDFQFGGIVNRSPLVIGISTDGAAPVFGQAIRTRIEAILPRGLKAWAEAARDWRPAVQARELAFRARRLFWERFTARAMASLARAPTDTDRDELLSQLDAIEAEAAGRGRVTLVGAGPGDPELLTLRAVRELQSADVILHDDLVSAEVLELARREATRILVGKKGHGPSCKQDDINALMVRLGREGKHVVRLKGGDPGIFGRMAEEIDACRGAGLPVAIVPGITTAQGAAAALGLSLTLRRGAQRVQFITGHADNGKLPDRLDRSALADPNATTVIYMPRRTWGQLAAEMMANGLDPQTPALAVRAATRTDQRHVLATLATLEHEMATLPDGAVIVMVGRAMAEAGWQDRAATLAEEAKALALA